ncbi:MAG TPA: ABC transporter substrate-binding protein, partial [Acidimicrobiales bacterium]|nr:ABC transporter substrate-binding protein [Acidimicrobiales bacterium]
GNHTYTIGILTDLTGPAASGNKTIVQGVQAGVLLAKRDGYTIKYVVGDTTTSPSGALSAAQKMVEQDHVFAVIAHSALAFAATTYLTQHNIPVVGAAEDGTEWQTSKNMFGVYGAVHTEAVSTTDGDFFKMQGVTTVGALGYSISPSSSESAQGAAKSAANVGLKVGFVDAAFPFGSTNVQPIALQMKSAGVDGITATVDPNTGFALVTALRQAGADLKVALLPTGYGGDLLQAGPGALQEAQNVYFTLTYEPVEMHTPATEQFQADLKSVGVTDEPTYAEYNGYLSVALLIKGLSAAGSNPTQASLITALSNIHDWDALGMFGTHHLDINNRTAAGQTNCVWVTKLVGNNFQLVPGADPICGHLIPGLTVSPAS